MIALLSAAVAAILGALSRGWRFGMAHADMPTKVNTVVAVCAFILVAASMVVAVLAYIAATGRADLHAELRSRFSEVNQPVFEAAPAGESPFPDWRKIASWRQRSAR